MINKKYVLQFVFMLSFGFCLGQSNLLDYGEWTIGSGNMNGFTAMAQANESNRIESANPFGSSSVVWECSPNPVGGLDGGFSALSNQTLNVNSSYQLSMWIKQNGSNVGTAQFDIKCEDSAGNETTTRLDGSSNSQRLVYQSPLPSQDTWFLVVTYIYPTSYVGEYNKGGIFNAATGAKIANTGEFEFTSPNPTLTFRGFFHSATSTNESVYYFDPRVYEVNSETPDINDLLGLSDSNGGGLWSENSNDIYYTNGNVGIGTDAPDAPLAVNGRIHASEVKVDTNFPAPDYVFYEDYDLKSLEEIQEYINENGHLPNIPSAKEIEANGIELGLMNMKLLEKIEELTLYILKQDKINNQQQIELNAIREKLKTIKSE